MSFVPLLCTILQFTNVASVTGLGNWGKGKLMLTWNGQWCSRKRDVFIFIFLTALVD